MYISFAQSAVIYGSTESDVLQRNYKIETKDLQERYHENKWRKIRILYGVLDIMD